MTENERLVEIINEVARSCGGLTARELADRLTKNDVVEVVRCKYCEHYRDGLCFNDKWWNDDCSVEVAENDYCSSGERKMSENENDREGKAR